MKVSQIGHLTKWISPKDVQEPDILLQYKEIQKQMKGQWDL